MSNLNRGLLIVLGLLGAGQALAEEPTSDPRGIWLTEAGDAKVHVSKCGEALCGTIVWLKQPIDPATGKPQVDDKNPDPALARRPIMGLSLFLNMKPDGDHWSGRIYNADNGKTYKSEVSLSGDKTLKVAGCVLIFCGSESWSRVVEAEKLASREH
jgi:uncharacterized protein (DUF2147 family)